MITALVLAAGLSTRMGQSKPLLPFGGRTVIEHIVSVLSGCSVDETLVITGHAGDAVADCLENWPVRTVYNPLYKTGEMLSSIKAGLQSLAAGTEAALIVLGDQPGMEAAVVEEVNLAYRQGQGSLIIPSYDMRRGHPILIARKHWREILDLSADQTLREFLRVCHQDIAYVEVATASVLRDMDVMADYRRELDFYEQAQPVRINLKEV